MLEYTTEDPVEKNVVELIRTVRTLELRVSIHEGSINGLAGRIEQLEHR
ncbi:MAG: hypothetical protein JRN12_05855 [Nitrososphaerota archaeon]|nr:hypothetical protein [Nitrososphaerota archaeon]MDG6951346.1 hypothetical protein [Nitrososphaerota archaeon]